MKNIFLTLLFAVVSIIVLSYSCNYDSSKKPAATAPSGEALTAADVHLGEHMRDIEYNTLKLGLSLQHRNQPLANFYIQEVNEAYEDLASKKIVDDGIDISSLLNQLLAPQLKQVQSVIEKNDTARFMPAYQTLIQTCNNCHHAAKHEFIVIEMPKQEYNGQNFTPASANN